MIYELTCGQPWVESSALLAGIAQLVEHDLAKVGVASSNLVSRSRFLSKESISKEEKAQCLAKSTGFFYLYCK